jgi:hypothetical protein
MIKIKGRNFAPEVLSCIPVKAMMELAKERGLNKEAWMETRVQSEIECATSALAQIGHLE